MSNLKRNTCPLVVCKCCSSLLCIVLAKTQNVASEYQTFLKAWKENFLPRYVCGVRSTCSSHLETKLHFINGPVVSCFLCPNSALVSNKLAKSALQWEARSKITTTLWFDWKFLTSGDTKYGQEDDALACLIGTSRLTSGDAMSEWMWCASTDVPQRAGQPRYLTLSPLPNKEAFCSPAP